MSSTELETYEDPIISLANDPNLNKEKSKTSQLVELIHNFPLMERKVSKLCSLSLIILQNLEKIELNLKSWAFLSLDINSNDHFDNDKNSNIKEFNNNISIKVLTDCKNLNAKLVKISHDLDYITKESRTLTPIEYISDSGTLLTSLNLRNIKLKSELTDKITVAYSKAKLINIGMELELMLTNNDEDDEDHENDITTVTTYKSFVANLLKQLNNTIDNEDMTGKTECLAVINDMEKMFEAFKLEKMQQENDRKQQEVRQKEIEWERERQQQQDRQREMEKERDTHFQTPEPYINIKYSHERHLDRPSRPQSRTQSPNINFQPPSMNIDDVDDDSDSYDSDMGSSSMFGSTYNSPLIHSITKSQPTTSSQLKHSSHKHDSDDLSMGGSSILHKTTLTEEMPYLLSAFNSAKNVEEDIKNFKGSSPDSINSNKKNHRSPLRESSSNSSDTSNSTIEDEQQQNNAHSLHFSKSHIPNTNLTSQSTFLSEQNKPSPYSYLYSNNSLLSRLGIRPQVITTELPKELGVNTSANIQPKLKLNKSANLLVKGNDDNELNDKDDKDKENVIKPLTQTNLRNHTLSSLSVTPNEFNDQVE